MQFNLATLLKKEKTRIEFDFVINSQSACKCYSGFNFKLKCSFVRVEMQSDNSGRNKSKTLVVLYWKVLGVNLLSGLPR